MTEQMRTFLKNVHDNVMLHGFRSGVPEDQVQQVLRDLWEHFHNLGAVKFSLPDQRVAFLRADSEEINLTNGEHSRVKHGITMVTQREDNE